MAAEQLYSEKSSWRPLQKLNQVSWNICLSRLNYQWIYSLIFWTPIFNRDVIMYFRAKKKKSLLSVNATVLSSLEWICMFFFSFDNLDYQYT